MGIVIGVKQKLMDFLMRPVHFIEKVCIWTGAVVLVGMGILAILAGMFFYSLPNLGKQSFDDVQKTAIKRVKTRFDAKAAARKYRWIPLKKVNRDLIYAIVMSEDSEFFEHQGVNYTAMMDSLAENIKKREYATGASTITQQVVKNVFLRNEKSIIRKLKEIFIAKRLEARFTKNEILELYLNIAEFGPDLYGISMVSSKIFKKPPSKINAAEGAFMALLLPSPRRHFYTLYQNKNFSKKKRRKYRRVLNDMLYNEFISVKSYRRYLNYRFYR